MYVISKFDGNWNLKQQQNKPTQKFQGRMNVSGATTIERTTEKPEKNSKEGREHGKKVEQTVDFESKSHCGKLK